MENKIDSNTSDLSDFAKNIMLKNEKREFMGHILSISAGYLILTLWLNSIRATAPYWFVWVLIIVQFFLYCWIFSTSLGRSEALGLKKKSGLSPFYYPWCFG